MRILAARILMMALAAALAVTTPAHAQGTAFSIDTVHSRVMFRVRHLGVSWVTGNFRAFSGTFVFDTVNVANSRAEARIATHSVFTDNDRRDNHLRSNDFFAADSFPTITFTGRRFERAGEPGMYRLTGDLTIRGITRAVTLEVELTGSRTLPAQGGQRRAVVGFLATGRVNRHDFGLRWNNIIEGVNVVGDEVRITIEVEARQSAT